jgi:hypothetical protein
LIHWIPAIEEGKAGIYHLGVAIITISILIFEVSVQFSKPVAVSAAEHECGQIFISDCPHREGAFLVHWACSIDDLPGIGKFLDFGREEGWDHSYHPHSPVGLKSFNVGKKFTVVSMVVDTIFLKVCEQALVGGNRGHHALGLCIIGATETLDEFKEGNHILGAADHHKRIGTFEIFEIWGALMIDNNVGLGHVFVLFVFAILSFVVLAFP